MSNINATNFRANLFEYLDMAVSYGDVINISTKNGNAIVISEDDYRGLLETVNLCSIPGMEDKLVHGKNEPLDECEEFEW
ncbi:type II toxin-antitoxin system Phd/YefM family antitoxin [Peptoniphilus sp. SGI.035]|uniref:type II toxin-antitoxin system Phd/YefM family antitoxin n=1 Tax=unclassified Peptoniphilus TaxID=2637196 RepID=UPI002A81B908|nr:type II toxin-antitoxin system Phd/YefM family antitoxin [Peptoniphilus sp.]MDY3903017.1 type II toxin-antitoxin system Phd/YefM family antitoxin [Peptoniphilus sp.]